MPRLSDLVVLVTGCSSGIGRALVRAFDDNGHRTFATARHLESLDSLSGARIERLRLDVTDVASIQTAVASAVERAGRIDMIVNNAGYILAGPLAELPLDEFKRQLDTNVTSALALTQAVFPHMARAQSGRIVNIGSVVGLLPTPFAGAYCASKSALHMLSDVLRMELAPFGIAVVLAEPAAVRSNIAANAARGLERYASENSHYRAVHSHIVARAGTSQEDPMDADSFASQLVQAVTRATPPRVVRLGNGARTYAALAQLPRVALDNILSRKFGLDQLRREKED